MKILPIHDLKTERLLLRQVRPSDLEAFHRSLSSDPEVARWMLRNSHDDMEKTAASIRKTLAGNAANERREWVIAEQGSDAVIGDIALLRFDQEKNVCSFAYMLAKAHWGRGYMTEALKAVLSYAFREMEVGFVSADHFVGNPASGAVMEKAGLKKLNCLPGQYEKNGQILETVWYGCAREDWLRVT